MMTIKIMFNLLAPIILGYLVLAVMFRKNPLPFFFQVALSYGLGLGILTQWMLLLAIVNISYSVFVISVPLICGCVVLLIILLKSRSSPRNTLSFFSRANGAGKGLDLFIWVMAIYLIFNGIYVFFAALNIPIYGWDAIAQIAYKAKIIYVERSIAGIKSFPHAAYPLHVSLLGSWIAMNFNNWDTLLIKIIFPLAFCSFLTIYYYFLLQYTNRFWALLGCSILVSSDFFLYHATIFYNDFFLLYYNCSTLMLLLLWHKYKLNSFLWLAALFAGFATFVKVEGQMYLFLLCALFLILLHRQKISSLRAKIRTILKFAVPSFCIFGIFFFYRIFLGVFLEKKAGLEFTGQCLQRFIDVLDKLSIDMFLLGNWNIIWILLFASLIRTERIKKIFEIKFLVLALFLYFCPIIFLAVFTKSYIWLAGKGWHTALSRIMLHFFPITVMIIVLINGWSVKESQ